MNKRHALVFILLFLPILLLGCNVASVDNNAGTTRETASRLNDRLSPYPCVMVLDDVSDSEWESFVKGFEAIPLVIREQMEKNGTTVYVFSDENTVFAEKIREMQACDSLGRYEGESRIYHNSGTGEETVEIKEPSRILLRTGGKVDLSITLTHEVGHMIGDTHRRNCRSYYTVKSDSLKTLYEEYKDIISSYDKSAKTNVYDEAEFFAESFRIYVTDPEWLGRNAGAMKDYIRYAIALYLLDENEYNKEWSEWRNYE